MLLLEKADEMASAHRQWPYIYRYYAINYPFYRMELHSHREWELMYVVSGKCRVTCAAAREKEKERDYELREGEYILIGCGVAHSLTVERETPCRILNLEGRIEKAAGGLSLGILEEDAGFQELFAAREEILTGMDDGRLHEAINALILELKTCRDSKRNARALGPMGDFCTGQVLMLIARQRAAARKSRKNGSRYVRTARAYLEEHFDSELSVSELAGVCGISEGYLQRIFRRESGRTLKEEMLRLRVEKAKLLLEISSLPVVEVAVNAGFNSRQHFTEMFRQATGISPAAWRKIKSGLDMEDIATLDAGLTSED